MMNQYLNFFTAHWELTLLFIVAFIWVIVMEAKSRKMNAAGVEPQGAIALINKKSAQIFDLRKEELFKQSHIIGAKRVDFNPAKDDPKILKISPHTICLFVCNIGQTSGKVVEALRAKGYTQSYTLMGGMAAWQKENLPTVQEK